MRNSLRSLVAVLVILAVAAPQARAQQGWELGARGGVSVAKVSGDVEDVLDKSNRTGFSGGLFLTVGHSSRTPTDAGCLLIFQKPTRIRD